MRTENEIAQAIALMELPTSDGTMTQFADVLRWAMGEDNEFSTFIRLEQTALKDPSQRYRLFVGRALELLSEDMLKVDEDEE